MAAAGLFTIHWGEHPVFHFQGIKFSEIAQRSGNMHQALPVSGSVPDPGSSERPQWAPYEGVPEQRYTWGLGWGRRLGGETETHVSPGDMWNFGQIRDLDSFLLTVGEAGRIQTCVWLHQGFTLVIAFWSWSEEGDVFAPLGVGGEIRNRISVKRSFSLAKWTVKMCGTMGQNLGRKQNPLTSVR